MNAVYTSCRRSSPIMKEHRLTLFYSKIIKTTPTAFVRASISEDSSNYAKRIETAWLISQQPTPVACSVCVSNGNVECKWCHGTGFFILGDNMLCQVASHSTFCVICSGKGSVLCVDCKGTGFRAKWLEEPPISKQ